MGYGDNIVEGAVIGIQRSTPMAAQAVSGMVSAAAVGARATPLALQTPALQGQAQRMQTSALQGQAQRMQAPVLQGQAQQMQAPVLQGQAQRLQAARSGERPAAGRPELGKGMVIHFSPQITLPAGSPEAAKGAVMDAMQLSMADLERLIRRISADQARRAN